MSTPGTGNGLIDSAELVDRMRRATAEGWQPWELDLAQALLRLPPRSRSGGSGGCQKDRHAVGRDARMASVRRIFTIRFPEPYPSRGYVTQDRELATVRSRSPGQPGDPSTLVGDLREPERWHGHDYPYRETCWMFCWPMMLPAHSDVAAAHLVPHLSTWTSQGRSRMTLLPALAEADGPPEMA